MIPLYLGAELRLNRRTGKNEATGKKVYVDPELLRLHMHLIGATGAGKTTAIHTILRPLMLALRRKCCLFVIDPMGNLSADLLRFFANRRHCPDHVRERLVYVEPARKDVVHPFNPLLYTDEDDRYYQTMRAVDLVLRAWAAQDVTEQPRLLQWMYKAFCAAAMLGLPIAMCRYLIHPGTDEHREILNRIPGDIAHHWSEILRSKGSEATRILESTRNRLDPFFECGPVRRMFGCNRSFFDCERFIRERRIVILNVAKYGVLPGFMSNTIGALALNEIFETATRLATTEGRAVVDPTYILMDEFQRFVSVDIEDALPTVRQMGLRLIFAHQSCSQLESEEIDLTQMVWQAQSRLVFSNSAKDADILADELAKRTFDSKRIKDLRKTVRQIIVGYRKEWLESVSESEQHSRSRTSSEATGYRRGTAESKSPGSLGPTKSQSSGQDSSNSAGETDGDTHGSTKAKSQTNLPIHKTFKEISNITYESFDEWAIKWGQEIRQLDIGEAFLMLPGQTAIRKILVDHVPVPESAELADAVDQLKEENFASEFFISASEADREEERCRRQLMGLPPIQTDCETESDQASDNSGNDDAPKDDSPPPASFEL